MSVRSARVFSLSIFFALAARAGHDARFDPDDPRARAEARALAASGRTPEEQLQLLRLAHAEAVKYGLGRAPGPDAPAVSVQGSAWVNLGPNSGTQLSPLSQGVTDSGRAQKIVPHPSDPNVLYLATSGGGVWKTFNAQAAFTTTGGGPRWASITDQLGSQSIGAFALDPNSPDTLYVGLGDPFDVSSPGFFHSADGGQTWAGPLALHGSYGGSDQIATSTRDIAVDPSRSGVVLVATDVGLFRSQEGGISENWQLVRLNGSVAQECWSVAWVGPLTWLASCREGRQGKVYRSSDNGASWAPATGIDADVGRMTLAASASDSATPASAWVYLLAATSAGYAQKDVYWSYDGGRTFHSLGMDVSACGTSCPAPINSASGTNDQPDLNVLHDQAWYNQAIVVDPRDHRRLFIGGNLTMVRSQDGGRTWDVVSDWLPPSPTGGWEKGRLPYVHADFHAMAVSTSGATPYLYAGTDGGLFRSADVFTAPVATPSYCDELPRPGDPPHCPTTHFESRLNNGIVTHLVYSVAMDEHDATSPTLIGGLQDNGTRLRSPAAPTNFNQVIGGDGFGVGIGISNSGAASTSCRGKWGSLLVGTIYTAIWRSIDCGLGFQLAMNGICSSPSLLNGNPCNVYAPTNFFMKMASEQGDATGQTLVTFINDPAGATIYATRNGANTWAKANGGMTFPSRLYFVGTNSKTTGQWAVGSGSHVFTTLDGGQSWLSSATTPGTLVSGVAFEGTGGNVLWATAKGTGGPNVFRSADRGATWVDKSGNGLPAVPANAIKVDPQNSNVVYAGTELGLYRTTDGGQTWARYGRGLPLVSVTEISIALDASAIRVSTFGRGFWELYASGAAIAGVPGNGDFDHNQQLDGFDLVREAAVFGTTPANDDYDQTGNLVGATNVIDSADLAALEGRLGARP